MGIYSYFYLKIDNKVSFIGEFDCKVDVKGRIKMPSALKKQIHPDSQERYVVCRGIEKHLTIYPYQDWKRISTELDKLNLFVKKNREFVRFFYQGATELGLDSNERVLIPKKLLSYAGVSKDVVLFAYADKIELWAKDKYDKMLENEPVDFASLAEDVMGKINSSKEEDSQT